MAEAFRRISNTDATKMALEALNGCSFARFTYYLTGWELVFLGNNGDISLKCSDIEIPSIDIWWKALASLPVDIGDCHGRDDIIVAMLLTSNLCRHNVASTAIKDEGDIHLEFENGAELIVKGRCDPVDWTWDLLSEFGKHILKCEFGEVFTP